MFVAGTTKTTDSAATAAVVASVTAMTRRGHETVNEPDGLEQSKIRKRRSGIVTTSQATSERRFLGVDRHHFQFPSVEKLIKKYSHLIAQQQNAKNDHVRAYEYCNKCSSETSSASISLSPSPPPITMTAKTGARLYNDHNGENDNENQHAELKESQIEINNESCLIGPCSSEFDSAVVSDDGFWPVDVPDCGKHGSGSDSAIEILPDSDDDKYSLATTTNRSNSVSFEASGTGSGFAEDVFEFSDTIPLEKMTMKNCFRRRQTWTGPLQDETDEAKTAANVTDKVSVRKTCSLDQSKNGLGLRSLYKIRRKGSCFSNEEFDDDDMMEYRCVRTPSVVISDHSDDPNLASSTITLEEIEEFQNVRLENQMNNAFADSSSDCSGTSVWSNVNNCTNVLDNEYEIIECGRKISDCSTCSAFSFEEEEFTRTKVIFSASVCTFYWYR